MARNGADLALLLLGGFRHLADAATTELARRGIEDFRPSHDFAMRAIAAGADSASDLARRLSVSKQAAAKTIALLEERGYVTRVDDPVDARRKLLRVTAEGFGVMREGEAIFEELRDQWASRIGEAELARLEASLSALLGASPVRLDAPGWIAQELDPASGETEDFLSFSPTNSQSNPASAGTAAARSLRRPARRLPAARSRPSVRRCRFPSA